MDQADIPARLLKREGIGARVPRKEDARHLVGKGNFVGDFVLPGLQEVAFLRSSLAHAVVTGVEIPEALAGKVFLREMMPDAADIGSPSSLPTSTGLRQGPSRRRGHRDGGCADARHGGRPVGGRAGLV